MPQITVRYRHDSMLDDPEIIDRLKVVLAEVCARILDTTSWPVTAESFGFTINRVVPPSSITEDVIIELPLHAIPERVKASELHAATIAERVATILLSYGAPWGTTVGIRLSYGFVEWTRREIRFVE